MRRVTLGLVGLLVAMPLRAQDPAQGEPQGEGLRTVFYREPPPEVEEGPTVLSEVAEPVPVKPEEFYVAEYVTDPGRLEVRGRMIKPARATSGPGQAAHPKDDVYFSYPDEGPKPEIGERLLLVAIGRRIPARSADRLIAPTAVVEVLELGEDVIVGRLDAQFGAVLTGQVLVPIPRYPDFLAPEAEPVPGVYDLQGRIMEFVDEQPLHGLADRAFLDLGAADGVKVGDVFLAYLPARETRRQGIFGTGGSETLPPEAVAELRVVRVTENAATVTVDNLLLPRLEDGTWVERIRAMP